MLEGSNMLNWDRFAGEMHGSWEGKCIDQSERREKVQLVEDVPVEDTAGYKEVSWMNCETFAKILTSISNKPDDFRGKEMFQKLSKAIVYVVKREKL